MEGAPVGDREVKRTVSLIAVDPQTGSQTRVAGKPRDITKRRRETSSKRFMTNTPRTKSPWAPDPIEERFQRRSSAEVDIIARQDAFRK